MQGVITQECSLMLLQVGNIVDAQDYLGSWHLSIVIDEDGLNKKMIHFLPFTKANRNEMFSAPDDSQRIAPAFTRSEPSQEPYAQIETLRNYLSANPPKLSPSERSSSSSISRGGFPNVGMPSPKNTIEQS